MSICSLDSLVLNILVFVFFSQYWDYALTVFLDEIVYIHCHQQRKHEFVFILLRIFLPSFTIYSPLE